MLCPMYYVCKAVPLTVEHIFFFDPHARLIRGQKVLCMVGSLFCLCCGRLCHIQAWRSSKDWERKNIVLN